MNSLNKTYSQKSLYTLLGISILYFLIKGFNYLIIGSYVPILFICTAIILLYWSFTSNLKNHYRIVRFWAILIILWALTRLCIWLIFKIDLGLTESHIREQFGVFHHVISTIMLVIGFMILKQLKLKRKVVTNM